VTLDSAHRFDCEHCHQTIGDRQNKSDQHPPILARPAHPDHADRICGKCHQNETVMVKENRHYTLVGHIEAVRAAFAGELQSEQSANTSRFPVSARTNPETVAELAEDLLSRRCLRCHVYYPGDPYPQVFHGTGCASCHLAFAGGALASHEFNASPADERCLSCHYGNHVGSDYLGRYEHDLNEEYRTPYRVSPERIPPFGVEYHQLAPDVHQSAGMVCIDCHEMKEVMGTGLRAACSDCHKQADHIASESISRDDLKRSFTSAATGRIYSVPQMTDQAHERYGDRFSCQVCHAQWSFNDGSVYLLRIDHEEFDDFSKLSVDGSSEVQRIISSHIHPDGDLLEPFMTDKFSGEPVPGIWLRGFIERRWERLELVEEADGKVYVARPIVDLHLSWIDGDEQVRFDNVSSASPGTRRYAPHTIGKAGLYYEQRLSPFLDR
jgi:hypothetical protein